MLSFLIGLIDPITRVTNAIVKYKTELANAKTEQERIAAGERIRSLEARRDVLIAERSPINTIIRAGFAVPYVIYNAKLVVWDKVLAWGSTDPLSTELYNIEMIILGFYFVYEISRLFKR
jgi:hypothetical protein